MIPFRRSYRPIIRNAGWGQWESRRFTRSVADPASNEATQNQDEKRKDNVQLEEQLLQAGNHFNKSDSGSITSVFFMQSKVDGEFLKQLEGFPELEDVSLESTDIAVDDLVQLKDLKGLKSIHLTDKQFNAEVFSPLAGYTESTSVVFAWRFDRRRKVPVV